MITFEQIKSFKPCYSDKRLWELFPATLKEVLTRTDGPWQSVSDRDRVWVAVRILPLDIVKRFTLDCAKRVSKDKSIIQNIEDYLDGKPVDIKAVAEKAYAYAANAANAANDAYTASAAYAAAAVTSAVYAAAVVGNTAVYAAASNAANAAANAAYCTAYCTADVDAEQQHQINFLLRYV